jgi:hypothetical protein
MAELNRQISRNELASGLDGELAREPDASAFRLIATNHAR